MTSISRNKYIHKLDDTYTYCETIKMKPIGI